MKFAVRGALALAVLALLGMALGQEEDLDQALICSAGRSCQFSADVNLRTQDRAESADEQESDGFKDIQMTLDFDVIASCSSNANEAGYQYFRVVVTEVMGGMPGKEAEFKKLPFFFVQSEETGKVVSIYTSSADKKSARAIKHQLIASLAKKFNRQAAQQAQSMMADIQGGQQVQPRSYVFDGEDETGPFTAHHEIHPEADGGFTLIEALNYKTSGSSSVSQKAVKEKTKDGKNIKVSAKKVAKTRVDGKGRVVKIKEAAEAKVGSGKPPKRKAIQPTPDMGEAKFKLEFDVIRVSKEDVSTCSNEFESKSLQDFETTINAEVGGVEERQPGRQYNFDELDHDEFEDVDDSVLVQEAQRQLDAGNVKIDDLQHVSRPSNIKQIIDSAWDRYEANALSKDDLKSVLAVAGQVASPDAYTSLLDLVKDPHSDEDLRTQALLALQPVPGAPPVPSFVLDSVADVAFSADELSNDAALTLGTLADGHPMAQAHVARLEQELNMNNGDAERLINLQDAISNARGVDQSVSTVDVEEDLEIDEDDEEAEANAVSNVDMGWSGNKSLLNKKWKLCGNKNFEINSLARVGAKWDTTQAKAEAIAQMNTRVLKYKKNLLHVGYTALAKGNKVSASFKFSVVGKVLKSWSKSAESKWVKYGGACPTHIKAAPKAWGKEWKKTFFTFSARFMLGPVPLKVSVSVTGAIGISAHVGGYINCKSKTSTMKSGGDVQLMGGAHPYGTVGVSATAAVDAFIARAGVQGSLNLLKGGVPVYAIARMKDACGKVDLELGALSGNIKLFAEVGLATSDLQTNVDDLQIEQSPFVAEMQQGQQKSWFRRKYRRLRRAASRAWRGIKRGARAVGRGLKKVGRAVWKGVKAVAKVMKKRWEKVIIKWAGASKRINLYKLCYKLNLGRFFGGKKPEDKKTTKATAKKPAAACPAGSKKGPAGLTWNKFQSWIAKQTSAKTTPKSRSAAYKQYKAGKCVTLSPPKKSGHHHGHHHHHHATAIRQAQRTRDAIRTTSQRTRSTARKQARSIKKKANNAGYRTRDTVRDAGRRDRHVARSASRRTKALAQTQAKAERRQQRRSELRAKAAAKKNRKVARRMGDRIKKTVSAMEKTEQQRRMRALLRRQGKRERARNHRLEAEIRRRANRKRFQKLAALSRSNEARIKKRIRADRAARREKRSFRHLRHQEQRRFRKLRRKQAQSKERKFIRRQTGQKKTLRHALHHIKHKLARAWRSARERRRLKRVDKTVRRKTAAKKKTRGWFHRLGHKIRSMAKKVGRKAKRGWVKIKGIWRRSRARRAARRNALKQAKLVRRNAARARARARHARFHKMLRSRFRRARKTARKGARSLKKRWRHHHHHARARRRARRLRTRTRRSSRRARWLTRRNARRVKATIRRKSRSRKRASLWARLKKGVRRVKVTGRRAARRGKTALRKLMTRSKNAARRVAGRARKVARRMGKRVLGASRRAGRRLMRRM